ncbi:DNA repair protein RecO [Marinobacter vulgaris]|uniref:DNA repair protein RecO n=1 Tax=Marinobacter vulgaris TaxID=1928331 RepID=A0A2V3ZIV7_9GAMM|nr:DNA repair protein RecO [Marinobacter vulgaris]PXX90260.1 DNA repair protein RecO [Marinobacter vulgaris]TSJ69715.1 DNA repair protein RecO [Marinobacter vulgaris]
MTGPVRQEPAYVLHRRPWRETSLMVDIFSLSAGRITIVARGGNTAKSPLKAQLQPFQPLLLDWTGRSDLKTLIQAEVRGGPALKRTLALYSGLYVNELLQRLLPLADPHPHLFASYIDVIAELSAAIDVEPVLRRFEQSLAAELGYDFAWDMATDTGFTVEANEYYCYDPEQGILAASSPGVRLQNLHGATLLALASGDLESIECRRVAKRVTRVLVDYLLQGRPLNSRTLFSHHRGDRNEP